MAGNFREVYNVTGLLEKSAQKVFLGIVISGLISVSLLLSFIGICSVYGCCDKHKKGRWMLWKVFFYKNNFYNYKFVMKSHFKLIYRYGEDDMGNNQVNEVAIIGLPEGTYEQIDIDTDFSAMDIWFKWLNEKF